MAGLHFDITGDNANFLRKLDEARNGVRSTSKQVEESGLSIEQMFGRLAKGAAAFGAGITAKEIVSNIVRVRGEFQQLEVAFNTMLGSEQKATALMSQLVKTAATTPFDLQSVAQGAKQLLAYGDNVENVNEDLVRLGNIAAGLSQPLNDLVYLYGTTMTQGRLYTQDFNQFTGRGIPMIKELAKQFNVAESEVKGLVEAGKVGFPEVQKVIQSLTNEGGMFYNLMEEQSKTITGQISNIEDSIATMYNNIGKQSEGFINDALSGVSYLVENYEEVGKTVLELAAFYGAYKAVLISVAAYQNVAVGTTYAVEIAELSKLVPLKHQAANQDIIAAVNSGKLTQAKAEQVIALRAEVAAKMESILATKTQTQSDYSSALASYKTSRLKYASAQEQMALAQSQMAIAIKSGSVEEIANARKNAQTVKTELNSAAIAKNSAHKAVAIAATNSKSASDAFNTMQTGLNTAAQNTNTVSTNILTVAKTKLAMVSRALGLSMLANPYVLATAAVVGLGYGIYKVITAETDVEEAIRTTNETLEAQKKHYDDLKSKSSELSGLLINESKSMEERFIAYRQLQRLMPNVFKDMDFEIAKRLSNTDAIKLETDEILRQQRIGLKTKVVMSQQKIQGLENSIIKTNNIGGYTGALKEDLDAAKQELEIYQKALKDFEDAKKESEKSKNDPVVQNKSYWETQKKETQSQLDALTDIEAAGAKGAALKQKIAGYDKKINAFSTNTTKQDNQTDKLREQQEKYNLLLDKQKLEQIRAEEDRWNQVWQAQIDAMDEGSEKTLSQMELNHERELQAIDREKEDLLRKKYDEAKALFDADEAIKTQKTSGYKPQSFDGSGIVLSPTESTQFDSKYKSTLDKQAKERQAYYASEKQAMNEYLAEYGAYMQKRQAIVDLYNERIAKATTKGEELSLGEEMKKSLASVDDEVQKKTSIITKLFSDMNKRTVADMRAIADEAQAMLDYVNGGEFKTDDSGKGMFGLTKEQFDILSQSPEKLQAIKDEIANVSNEADNAETSFNKMANGLDKIFSSGKDTNKLKEGLEELEEGFNDVMRVGEFLSDTISNLGEAFGNDTLQGIADGINVAMDAANSAMQGAKAGSIFGPIGAAAGAAIGLVGSLASSFAKIHDAKNEKRIQRLQDQIEVLEKSYDKLGDSIEKAYSKDATKLINQQNTLLEQQKVLIQNQIREEQDKKKTDYGRIKEWQNQIEEINKLIEDNKEKAIDAIFGEDLKSSIDNFAQAYANAWTSGEDKAKSAKDTVRDMMRQMVTESIKAAIQSSGKMEEIRNKLKQFYADNVLSGWEQDYIYNMADNLQKELDGKFGWADGLMKDEKATSQDSSKGGFEAMSQDTGNELNGRFTAFQISNEEIKNSMLSILTSVNLLSVSVNSNGITLVEIRNLMISSNSYLEDIAKYTKLLIDCKKELETIKNNTKSL